MIKKLLFLLVVLGTIYAPIELTRWIVFYILTEGRFIFEITFMWVWYVAAMVLVGVLIWKRSGNGHI